MSKSGQRITKSEFNGVLQIYQYFFKYKLAFTGTA